MELTPKFESVLNGLSIEDREAVEDYIEVMLFLSYTEGVRIGHLIAKDEEANCFVCTKGRDSV